MINVFVTGGAGYIGSHMVRVLLRAGHGVVVLDDLSAGHAETIPAEAIFAKGDIRDGALVSGLLHEHAIKAVFHFASRIQVGESVRDPRLYWRDNLAASVALLESVLDAGIRRFILSSTAAVYGDPIRVPIDEGHPTAPVNPYGATKLALEHVLDSYARAYGLRYAALRYFNAAGADVAAGLSERHEPETHLIPLVLDAALGRRAITVFGDDYATEDGTCVRDYIHVNDLADAHLAALDYLDRGGESGAFNLGTGHGQSVRDVIACVEKVTGKKVPVTMGLRRAGDPPVLVASPERAMRLLGWAPKRAALEDIVRDAWNAHPK